MANNTSTLTSADLINDPVVQAAIKTLEDFYRSNPTRQIVSDVLDDNNYQYVELVQKGGGVLGVALVGYTYILEHFGIRFLRLAGTSAGAINTALMTVIDTKQDAKSEKIADYLCNMDFFSFVDGHPFARYLIKKFVTDTKFETQALRLVLILFGGLGLFGLLDIITLGLRHYWAWASAASLVSFILTGLFTLIILVALLYGLYMLKRLKASGYGINPGVVFYEWVKARMEENGVTTVTKLKEKASSIPNLHIRPGVDNTTTGLAGDVTFITSELVTENKIELPLMADLFRLDIDDLHPARFVRASMSIPLFFESHIINDIPADKPEIIAAWFKHLCIDEKKVPDTCRFVDGGMLSDFPVNVFYNPKVIEPRLPVFGIDLDDSDPARDTGKNSPNWSLGSYIGRLFNTIRYYYDKDFLEKNYVFQKGIGHIPLYDINWLNFFLTNKLKLEMFQRGANTAVDFLMKFKWEEYRAARIALQQNINNRSKPINPDDHDPAPAQ